MSITLPCIAPTEDAREQAHVDEVVTDVLDDLKLIGEILQHARDRLRNELHTSNVVLCDAGTGLDIVAWIEQLVPHDAACVEALAVETAVDEWRNI